MQSVVIPQAPNRGSTSDIEAVVADTRDASFVTARTGTFASHYGATDRDNLASKGLRINWLRIGPPQGLGSSAFFESAP